VIKFLKYFIEQSQNIHHCYWDRNIGNRKIEKDQIKKNKNFDENDCQIL